MQQPANTSTGAAPTVGRYRLVREIGRGFSSVVYEAVDTRRGRRVALKVLTFLQSLSPARRQDLAERFGREARAISALSHPAIVAIYEVGQAGDGREFIAMEYLAGETLRARLQREGTVPPDEAVSIALQVAEALQYAHERGIIHRDVKPDNIFIQPDGAAKLMDFGVAHMLSDEDLTQAGTVVGSPAYMSPEQISGQPLDGRSDVFSLGVTLAEMVMGAKPFEAPNIPAVMNQILRRAPHLGDVQPRTLRPVLERAMAKSRASRYAGPAALAEALRRKVVPQLTPPDSTVVMPLSVVQGLSGSGARDRTKRRQTAWLGILAVGLAILISIPFLPALAARVRLLQAAAVRRPAAPAAIHWGKTHRIAALWQRSKHGRHSRRQRRARQEEAIPIRIEERPVEEQQAERRPSSSDRRSHLTASAPVSAAPAVLSAPPPQVALAPPQPTSAPPAPQVKIGASRQEQRDGTDIPPPPPDETAEQPGPDIATGPPPAPRDRTIPDSPPRVVRRTAPSYPGAAEAAAQQGTVRVRVHVNEDGDVTNATVVKSSGATALDEAAVDCVRHWEYDPAFRDGQAVPGVVTERIVFRLD